MDSGSEKENLHLLLLLHARLSSVRPASVRATPCRSFSVSAARCSSKGPPRMSCVADEETTTRRRLAPTNAPTLSSSSSSSLRSHAARMTGLAAVRPTANTSEAGEDPWAGTSGAQKPAENASVRVAWEVETRVAASTDTSRSASRMRSRASTRMLASACTT
eukprot:3808353-Rhodomonas_salina.1